jgi:hypothetical protein
MLSMGRPYSALRRAVQDFKARQPKSISISEESNGRKSGIGDL